MNDLQKIVVLCVVVLLVGGAFFAGSKYQAGRVITDSDVQNNTDDLPLLPLDDRTDAPPVEEPIAEPGDTGAPTNPVACTLDAKICPDGSAVGRVGPNCEFAACPAIESEPDPVVEGIVCTEEQKQAEACTMQYAPVCGLVAVQCITTPCDPVPETFGNACSACAQGNVISYTEGECTIAD